MTNNPRSNSPTLLRATRAAVTILAVLTLFTASPRSALAGRAHHQAFKEGESAARRGEWDWAVVYMQRAVDLKPDNLEYRSRLTQAKIQASYVHFELGKRHLVAGNLEQAIAEIQQTVALNPAHQYAYVELEKAINEWRLDQEASAQDSNVMDGFLAEADAASVGSVPKLDPTSNIPIQFSVEDKTIREIFKIIQDVTNINVIFDEGVKLEEKTSFVTDNVTLEEALDLLMLQQALTYKVYNDHTILVYPDTPTKQREYEDQIIRTFYLSNTDVKDVNQILRGVIDIRKTAVNEKLNAITIRDSQDKIAIAGRLIEANDKAKAELVINLEILEVNRSKLKSYGLDITTGGAGGITTSVGFDDTQVRLNNTRRLNQAGSWILGPIPSAVLTLLKSDADTRILSRPQVRVTDGEKVSIHLGDRVPIPQTTFNSSNSTGGGAVVPVTSYTYEDVGIVIQLEPRIHHNREVSLKLQAEISSVVATNSSGQPTIGSREIDTNIRLRDGESNLLAGLFQETASDSYRGLPGIGDTPILRSIFGNTSRNKTETEIVVTVTPHIVRIPDIGAEDLMPLHVGTERNTRLRGDSKYGVGGSPFRRPGEEVQANVFTGLRPGATDQDRERMIAPLENAQPNRTAPADEQGSFGTASSTTSAQTSAPDLTSATPPARGGTSPASAPPPAAGAARPGPGSASAAAPTPTGPAVLSLRASQSTIRVGQEFTIEVAVDTSGHELAHAPYHVLHDPALVQVLRVVEGPFLRSAGANTVFFPSIDPGRVIVGHSQLGTSAAVSGLGTLAVLSVRATASGQVTFSFDGAAPADRANEGVSVRTESVTVTISP